MIEPMEPMTSQEIMANLDDAARDRFVKFQETFESLGWKLVVEHAQAKVFEHGVLGANAKTWEACNEHRGARLAWDRVSKLADEFMNAFEQAAWQAKLDKTSSETEESP